MKALFRLFASLKLTVVLLSALLLLVFFGTLDQVNFGIYEVQKRYFESFIAFWHYPLEWPGGNYLRWVLIPLPGGAALGLFLIINLVCAHFKYFKASWSKVGIICIHGGLILLGLSGFLTAWLQQEARMWIKEGEQSNYAESFLENEFVVTDLSDERVDQVYSFAEDTLTRGAVLSSSTLPFKIHVDEYYPNAEIGMRAQNPDGPPSLATHGAGKRMEMVVLPKPVTYRQDEANTATAYVTLIGEEEEIGTWLVSNLMDERFPPQTFEYMGKSFAIALRFKRTYFPFSLALEKFSFDKYPGTEIPRNFSSSIRVINPAKSENRPVLIYMNHPLRYGGYTFYQASFSPNQTESMLQVVRNPGFMLPYISLLIIGGGLLFQSLFHLTRFIRAR